MQKVDFKAALNLQDLRHCRVVLQSDLHGGGGGLQVACAQLPNQATHCHEGVGSSVCHLYPIVRPAAITGQVAGGADANGG